jgi:hypothetical protein
MNALRYVQMVLWSFFCIRKGTQAREEIASVKPLPLNTTAIALAPSFVATLLIVVGLVVRHSA